MIGGNQTHVIVVVSNGVVTDVWCNRTPAICTIVDHQQVERKGYDVETAVEKVTNHNHYGRAELDPDDYFDV